MEKSNLIINYLPAHIQENDLAEMCEPFGPYQSVKIVRDKNTGMSMGFGFVNYEENASAEAAVKKLNGLELPQHPGTWHGSGPRPMKKIKVSIARPAWKANIHSNLYVANIPIEYDAQKIKAMFGPVFGPHVEHLRMLRDNSNGKYSPEQNIDEDTGSNNKGKFRGIAVIRFDTEENAAAAMEKFNGTAVPDMPTSHLPLHVKPWRPEFRADRVPQKTPLHTKRNFRGPQRSAQQTGPGGDASGAYPQDHRSSNRVKRSATSRSSARGEHRPGDSDGCVDSSSNTSTHKNSCVGGCVGRSGGSLDGCVPSLSIDVKTGESASLGSGRHGPGYGGHPICNQEAAVRSLSARTLGAASYQATQPQQVTTSRGSPTWVRSPAMVSWCVPRDYLRYVGPSPRRVNAPVATYPVPVSHCTGTPHQCQWQGRNCGDSHITESVVYGDTVPHNITPAIGFSEGPVGSSQPLSGEAASAYQTPAKQRTLAKSETPGQNAFPSITPIMISPQMEQVTKAILYDQAGIVGSSVQVGPDRSWGCASFSSLAAAEQAIHSLHGTHLGEGVNFLVEFFPHSNQSENIRGDNSLFVAAASRASHPGTQLEVKS